MNKKEVLEIRKQFKIENLTGCGRIVGCYVDGIERTSLMKFEKSIHSIEEDDMFKYLDLLKASLGGSFGKTLHDVAFPLNEEKPGGKQFFLRHLLESGLKDEAMLDEFYSMVIDNCEVSERYIILLFCDTYDVPGKASDGYELEDNTDVYDYLVCMFCPVTLSKPELSLNQDASDIINSPRNWNIKKPQHAFLFPSFNNRETDLHEALYFTKKIDQQDIVSEVLGCEPILSDKKQKSFLESVMTEVFGDGCNYETIETVLSSLQEIKEEDEYKMINAAEMGKILERAGADKEQLSVFERIYDKTIGEGNELLPASLLGGDKIDITTPDMLVKIASEVSDRVETRVIDGRPCLVIQISGSLSVDNIPVSLKQ